MTKSYKDWYELSPYSLKNKKGQIMENIWQFSKVYETVPAYTAYYSRYNKKVIWEHGAETHVKSDKLTNDYWKWRQKGMDNKYAVRYPVGFYHRHKCIYAIKENKKKYSSKSKKLDYVESRKAIYVPLYMKLVREEKKFDKLKKMLENGENLLIIEVDGPHEESLKYYKDKYSVSSKFIENSTIVVNKDNMKIMLNDRKHAFGHGYCLAMAVLDMDDIL
jgi:hypothetical protein